MSLLNLATVKEMNAAIAAVVRTINMDIAALKSDVQALQGSVTSASDQLDQLEALVGNLTPENFTQADIDALDAQVKSAKSALDAAVEGNPVPPSPDPANPPDVS